MARRPGLACVPRLREQPRAGAAGIALAWALVLAGGQRLREPSTEPL